MKSTYRCFAMAALAASLVAAICLPVFADTYHNATFSGAIFGGNANVKAPFDVVLTQGGAISGSFIVDDNLIPPANSGWVNVFFSSYPDAAVIPAATAFTINLGTSSLIFTLADAVQGSGAIQYKDGQFVGFFFNADFIFSDGKPYRFDDQGGTWSIQLLNEPGGYSIGNKVNGYIGGMTMGLPYNPPPPPAVPIPAAFWLLASGLLTIRVLKRKTGR